MTEWLFSAAMDRRELLEHVSVLGRAFTGLGLDAQARRLRLYYLAARYGLLGPRNEVDVKWNEALVVSWMQALRLPPFEGALPVQRPGVGCPACGVAQGTVPSGRTELVFPGGARMKCQACARVWLELDVDQRVPTGGRAATLGRMSDTTQAARDALQKGGKLAAFLDPEGRARLAAMAREERYAAGHVVFKEGDVGGAFYVVLSGEVAVDAADDGAPKRIATLGPGQFFGEMSTVTNQPRSATVTVLAEARLLAFDREPVVALLKDAPKLKEALSKVSVARSEDALAKLLSGD